MSGRTRAALGAWPYEAWLIALARRMYRTDAAAFFSRMDADRLVARLRGCDKGGEPLPITVSIGGAVAASGMTVPRVFEVCDRALYQVKERGRDSFLVQGCPGSGF